MTIRDLAALVAFGAYLLRGNNQVQSADWAFSAADAFIAKRGEDGSIDVKISGYVGVDGEIKTYESSYT